MLAFVYFNVPRMILVGSRVGTHIVFCLIDAIRSYSWRL